MPSINFNMGQVPFRLTPEEMGTPDYGKALMQGYEAFQKQQEAANTPKRLSESLLDQQLTNKINTTKAKYAEQNEKANLSHLQATTDNAHRKMELIPYRKQLLEAQTQHALRPEKPQMGNFEKAFEAAKRIEERYGSDSKEAKQARNYVTRLSEGNNGI